MAESTATKVEIPVRQGDVLDGKYRVDSVLGVGGMGAVVAATHLQLAQRVAIKLLLSSRNDKEEIERLHRLLNEARVVAKMKSVHVARVLDVGTLDGGNPYMVMELLEGSDLERHLEDRGPLSIDEAVDFVLQACEAVAEAHRLGVVHRDLKPSNLFLTKSVDKRPLIKVLDFGLSKSVRGDKGTASITRPLEIVGTPSYMSPEQLRSTRDVDERTDIWSLGVILYELVSRSLPFDNTSIPDLCASIVRDAPKACPRHLPKGIQDAITKCLQKNPDDRFPDITALAAALAPFAPDDEHSERIARVRQETSPDAVELLANARTSQRLHLGGESVLEEDEGFGAEDEEPPPKSSRLGILLAILLVAAGGAGAGFLFIELVARSSKPAPAAQTAPPALAALPSAAPIPSASNPPETPPPATSSSVAKIDPAPIEPASPAPPTSKAWLAGQKPLAKPRPGPHTGRPGGRDTTSAGGKETPTSPPTSTTDPDRFLESR
jgi:eukaryotic-like serine/threonine-protein kinase